MDAPDLSTSGAQSSKQTSERISALMEISKKIPQMLQHAGEAINALTGNDLTPEQREEHNDVKTLAARREIFKEHVSAFYTLLNDVTSSMTEETDKLVEAQLIRAEPPKKDFLGKDVSNEGLGSLDVGYLNSRTRDVGLAKEAELVKEMRSILERYATNIAQVELEANAMDES